MAAEILTSAPSDPEADAGPSIADVIEILPDAVYDNPTALGLAYFARDVALYAALVAALVFMNNPILLVPLWILAGIVISALFIVGHDAAHGALFKSKRLSYVIGQLAMLPSLHVYEAWVFGHNRIHHGHTVREVMDYVWHPTSPEAYRALSLPERLLHRLKWSWLGAGVYYGWDIWWRNMMRFTPPEKIAADVRRDRAHRGLLRRRRERAPARARRAHVRRGDWRAVDVDQGVRGAVRVLELLDRDLGLRAPHLAGHRLARAGASGRASRARWKARPSCTFPRG